jgi:F-type H+-transporting ATPase subunit b
LLIDWITVAAQIVNFLILVVLLKVFLYDRIIEAMDKREQRIADRLAEAEQKKREAESEKREFERKQRQLAEERKKAMQEAERQAEARRKELVEKARKDVDEMARGWRRSIERDKEDLLEGLAKLTADQAVKIAERAVADLAGGDLRKGAAELFLEKLDRLGEDDLKALAEGAGKNDNVVEVLTVDELDSAHKQKITRAVHERVGEDIEVDYAPGEVRLGVVLRTRGRKFDWSLDGYLSDYRDKVGEALAGEMRRLREEEGQEERGPGEEDSREEEGRSQS